MLNSLCDGDDILGFTNAVVKPALTFAHTAKIKFDGEKSKLKHTVKQCVNDLVIHRSAMQRVWVCNDCYAFG